MDSLRPEAAALVDAYDFTDTVLASSIGKFDGHL